MTVNTVTNLASLYYDIYDMSLMVLREENLLVNLVTPMQGQGAAARTVPIWSRASVQTISDGVDFSNHSAWNKSAEATFTPQERVAGFIMTDRMIATESSENLVAKAASELGGALAEQLDIDLAAEFANFANGKGSAGSAMSLSLVAAGIASIISGKVRGEKSVVLHPFQWHDVWVELGQPASNKAFLGESANQAMQEYVVTRMEGATWFTSANIEVDASDDAYGGVFTREGIGYDQRKAFTLESERDASLRANEWTASMDYDTGVLRDDAGRYLLSDASEPTGF